MMRLETERLYLREITAADLPAWMAVLGDRENMKHYRYAFDEERVQNWIERNSERYRVFGFGLWAVIRKDTGELIGDCGVTMQNINGVIRPEIGYHIRRDCQRQGYAKEAAGACRDWIFENTPFRVVYSYMTLANEASWATAKACGMELAERFVDEGCEMVAYAITRQTWERRDG